jgi:hypothetical protein
LSAIEQLMDEETQAAAKAAAKKAKKLKQKSKKQQAQQPESPSHGRVPDESDDNAEQSTIEPGHSQPEPWVLDPELQPEMPPAAFEGLSSAPRILHVTDRQSSGCTAVSVGQPLTTSLIVGARLTADLHLAKGQQGVAGQQMIKFQDSLTAYSYQQLQCHLHVVHQPAQRRLILPLQA